MTDVGADLLRVVDAAGYLIVRSPGLCDEHDHSGAAWDFLASLAAFARFICTPCHRDAPSPAAHARDGRADPCPKAHAAI